MSDQATQLRRLVRAADSGSAHGARWRPARRPRRARPSRRPDGLAQAIAVTSGKGGVGKTNLAVNLAVCLSRLGRRVCLLDADLGLANADVLCSLTPRRTLEHVVNGRCRLAEAMLLAPGGFRLIAGACGVAGLADMSRADRQILLEQLSVLDALADDVIIDTSAGLSENVLAFAIAARRVLVATTPEPTALTDGYGMIKALTARSPHVRPQLVVNLVASTAEARSVHGRMNRVTRTFLGRELPHAASIPADPAVPEAVRHRVPFALYAPGSPATVAVEGLAARLAGLPDPAAGGAEAGFFARLSRWFGAGSPGAGNSYRR